MWLCIFIKHQNSTLPVLIKYSNNWGILKDDTLVYYDVKYGSQKPLTHTRTVCIPIDI